MHLLVSFCNVKSAGQPSLGLLDTLRWEFKVFELPSGLYPFAGATGLAITDRFVYAAVQPTNTSAGTRSDSLLVFDSSELRLLNHYVFRLAVDVHSLCVSDMHLYAVSSGTDEVISLRLKDESVVSETVFWRPESDARREDAHHLNAICEWSGSLVVSGFGKKDGSQWTSARDGFIVDVHRDEELETELDQPHSLAPCGDSLFFCESREMAVRRLGESRAQQLPGYTRGLCVADAKLYVATSVGRKTSKSTGDIVDNPSESGIVAGECTVNRLSIENLEVERTIDLTAHAQEIYDLIPVGDTSRSLISSEIRRGDSLRELFTPMDQQTVWAKQTTANVAARNETTDELENRLTERSNSDARTAEELSQCHFRIELLRRDLEQHKASTKRTNDHLGQLDLAIRDLRAIAEFLRPQLQELKAEMRAMQDFVTKESERQRQRLEYAQLKPRIREIVRDSISEDATVLVVSKGDDELLNLDGRASWHFPQVEDGSYAGHYPASNEDAIAHLEALRTRGAEFLLFPKTAFWWFDHYGEFRHYLDSHYARIVRGSDCVIYDLTQEPQPDSCRPEMFWTDDAIERLRPLVPPVVQLGHTNGARRSVLVLGVYLARQQNTSEHVISTLAETCLCDVTQRWVALGGTPPPNMQEATTKTIIQRTPKFQIVNELLSLEKLSGYDYVLLCDDDIVLPRYFLDYFIPLQEQLNFTLAQPARTSNSYIDHAIVEQRPGVLARQTLFVEIGPVVSIHQSVFDLLFPFDLASPMGWGYENVWSCLLAERNMKLGIIDAIPVDHSLRRPVANYSWAEADQGRKDYLKKRQHYTTAQCMRVLKVFEIDSKTFRSSRGVFKISRAAPPWTNRYREDL